MSINGKDIVYYIGLLLSIASIVSRYIIFENNNERGYKALIPFYSSYIFSKTFNQEKLGKKLAISKAIFFVFSISLIIILMVVSFYFLLAFMLSFLVMFQSDIFFELFFNEIPYGSRILIYVLSILSIITFIIQFIYHIKLHYIYTLIKKAPAWFMIIWILLPSLGYLYFAFIYGKYDIPGLNTIEKEDLWD